jgi:hypothetical protein
LTEDPPLDAAALLKALVGHGVEFIVIGGFAVGAHGYQRATKDLDIVPAPTADNLQRLLEALNILEYRIHGVEEFDSDELVEPSLEALLAGGSWVLVTRYGRLDILQRPDPGLDYQKLERDALEAEVLGLPVRFCGYEDLVSMKLAAGRPEDRLDLERLRQAGGGD